MDDLHKELSELKQFIVDLKADRAATKEKEKREAWTKYVSLTVVVIAVFASIAAQWGGKYSSRTQMSQAQASDQWNYYQAKSVKQHLFETIGKQTLKNINPSDPEYAKEQKEFKDAVAKYESDKAAAKAKAEEFEKTRDNASKLGAKVGLAVSFFSVAIAMASICTVTKKKPLWFIAMLLAAGGLLEMIIAWTS
jgi:hypothetical protein